MNEIINKIKEKRESAIAGMVNPIITLNLEQTHAVLQRIEELELDKKTLMHDLAVVNLRLKK